LKGSAYSPLAILGAGSWGTALAVLLASYDQPVSLWEYDAVQVQAMQRDRCNHRYLPGVAFPASITVCENIQQALKVARDILIAVPSHAFVETLKSMKPFLPDHARILWATKGIDPASCELLHLCVTRELGARPMAVLSGPSFAKEVAAGLPTAVVVASNDADFAKDLVSRFNHGHFRVYTSSDMVGVQLGGAVKNVIALAAGAGDGLGLGANARSGLITRGLAEMMRLGLAMGAKRETFMGLSGLGDLVLTCTDDQSRNRRFGMMLAQGASFQKAEKMIDQVVEGVHNAYQVNELAERYQVEMPICRQVFRVLEGQVTLKQAVNELFARAPKAE
jgi:glycerol-3-phosphate dehydrogenase (NAD(P)+)